MVGQRVFTNSFDPNIYVYEYHIFSCYAAPVNNAAYTYSFPDVKDYQDFLGVIQASSEYDTGDSLR